MAGTWEGAQKTAARKAGVSLEEYRRQVDAGRKWCTLCRDWHRVEAFGSDVSKYDGLASSCRESKNRKARLLWWSRPL